MIRKTYIFHKKVDKYSSIRIFSTELLAIAKAMYIGLYDIGRGGFSFVYEIDFDNVTDIEIDGIDTSDYPDFCDAFILSAVWKDTGIELNEDELDALSEIDGLIHELVNEDLF
jgi:hypothetical protein